MKTLSRKCCIISKLEEQSQSGSLRSSQNFWTGLNAFGDPENHHEGNKFFKIIVQIDADYCNAVKFDVFHMDLHTSCAEPYNKN